MAVGDCAGGQFVVEATHGTSTIISNGSRSALILIEAWREMPIAQLDLESHNEMSVRVIDVPAQAGVKHP
jgi:hypothetical protein